MAITNHERIGRALGLLSEGLAPFVARECEARYGRDWVASVGRQEGDRTKRGSPTDAQLLLRTIWDEWQSIFRNVLGQTERTYVSELRETRNR